MGWSLKIKTSGYRRFFQKKKVIIDIQAILTGTTIEKSASRRKNNPDLLQESEEQDSEEANVDGDITAEANKKSMKTITTRLFQWKKNRRLWNIKKQ